MRKFLPVFLGLALAAAACSGGDDPIGTVGDTTFTMSDIDTLYEVDTVAIDDEFRLSLFRLMAVEALEQAAEADFGVVVDEAAVDVLYEERLAQIEDAGITVADALGFPGAAAEMLRFNSRLEVLLDDTMTALMAQPAFLEGFFEDPAVITEVCARHILVDTEEEATAAKERIDGGEEFGEVASAVSKDTGTLPTGDLGCSVAAGYVEPFAVATLEAPIGELVGPVETSFGFHLIVVDSRTSPTFDEVAANPEQYVPAQYAEAEFAVWANDTLGAAEVTLEPKYGVWTPAGITPPADPEE